MSVLTLEVPRSENACARMKESSVKVELLTARLRSMLDQERGRKYADFAAFAKHWNLPLALPVEDFAQLDQKIQRLNSLIGMQPLSAKHATAPLSTELAALQQKRKELLDTATDLYLGQTSSPEMREQLVLSHWTRLCEKYSHVIDPVFLTWRDETGFPSLAVHGAFSAEPSLFALQLTMPSRTKTGMTQNFAASAPMNSLSAYDDLRVKLQDRCVKFASAYTGEEVLESVKVGIRSVLPGLLPVKACQSLGAATPDFAVGKLAIVAEPRDGQWELFIESKAAPAPAPVSETRYSKPCPVIVGIGPMNTLFWVDSYDTTPTEEAMLLG